MAPLLALGGAVLFGALRLAYVFFYQQVRATPQEAGYGYQEILAGQMFGTIEMTVLLTAVLVAGKLLIRAVRLVCAGHRREAMALPPRQDLTRLTRRCGVAAVATVLVTLPVFGYLFGIKATYGDTVRNMSLFAPALQLLAVQASPARVSWTIATRPGMTDVRSLPCLLYLGQANGTALFYDVKTRDSLHLPSGQIQVTLPKTNSVNQDLCT